MKLFDRAGIILASGLGIGFCPFAPGTAGTLFAIPLYLELYTLTFWITANTSLNNVVVYVAFVVMLFILGVWASKIASFHWKSKDPQTVVIDEITGFLVAMTGVTPSTISIILGFILFRCLDIVKIWPANWIDRKIPGGLGIMLDDIASGLQTWVLLNIILFLSQML
ncbi:phosphatidylglycerophosphatase A [bacterium]|nr:phosphatidylglycerophosphatase A [candidate division CSSED10-310 bacterium]